MGVNFEEPEVIAKILAHLERTAPQQYPTALPLGARAADSQCSWRSGRSRPDAGPTGNGLATVGFGSP